jgi:hypothetical protein
LEEGRRWGVGGLGFLGEEFSRIAVAGDGMRGSGEEERVGAEPLEMRVERRWRLLRMRMSLEVGGVAARGGVVGAEGGGMWMTVSLEWAEECHNSIVGGGGVMAVSRLFFLRELAADEGRGCGVFGARSFVHDVSLDKGGNSGVWPLSILACNCFALTCRWRLSSTRLLAPLPLRLRADARSFPLMMLAFGGGCSIQRLSSGRGEGILTTGGWRSFTGGARAIK